MKISVIVPVYNEQSNIPVLIDRLVEVLKEYLEWEIIFVDDGSVDQSVEIISKFCSKEPKIKLISLTRNFGHQAAVSVGLRSSSGDATVVMDGDLQDPPEVVPDMISLWQNGNEVVYAVRRKRKEIWLKRLGYYLFYRLLSIMADHSIPRDSGDFCLIDRKALDQINALPERIRFVRGLRSWVGFRQVGYEFERDKRYADEVKYSLPKLINLAFDGLFSFTRRPLTLVMFAGILVTACSTIGILVTLYFKIFTDLVVPGMAGITILILFLGGTQLLVAGILGEYIGRIFEEVKQRPTAIIKGSKNLDSNVSN